MTILSKQRGFVGNAVHRVLASRARKAISTVTTEDLLPYFAAIVCAVISFGIWFAAW